MKKITAYSFANIWAFALASVFFVANQADGSTQTAFAFVASIIVLVTANLVAFAVSQ